LRKLAQHTPARTLAAIIDDNTETRLII